MQILQLERCHIIQFTDVNTSIKVAITLIGNPFSNNLICINGTKANLDWKLISMKTLEGGKSAFGERGKIYGNT